MFCWALALPTGYEAGMLVSIMIVCIIIIIIIIIIIMSSSSSSHINIITVAVTIIIGLLLLSLWLLVVVVAIVLLLLLILLVVVPLLCEAAMLREQYLQSVGIQNRFGSTCTRKKFRQENNYMFICTEEACFFTKALRSGTGASKTVPRHGFPSGIIR